ncbi:MAG: cytochrome P450 [Polyangiaceae bacterium]|jgi:cytochrome P450|nr:cytochrome P450 [Polyangiaceae bacterium]
MTLRAALHEATHRLLSATPPIDRRAPSPPADPVLGHLRAFRADQLGFLLRACTDHGDLVHLWFGNRLRRLDAYLCADPEGARHVLQEHHRNYHKRTRGFDTLRLVLGNGLLTSEGDFWLRQRRIAQPAFHRERIAGFAYQMVRAVEDRIERRWVPASRRGERLDVAAEMMRITLRIVGETMLSIDPSEDADRVGSALESLLVGFRRRMQSAVPLPIGWPTEENRKLQGAIATIDEVVLRVIEERRRSPEPRPDLLGMLMSATDEETGERMSDQQLRDEVVTLFLAGHETTALALSWAFLLLSLHPEAGRKLRDELRQVLQGRAPTAEDVPRLEYTRMVLQETLRLYPPAWNFGRTAREPDTLAGYPIPAGSLVLLCPYVMHRNPRLWDNPEGFDPERFSPQNSVNIPRFAYFPFGAGPRQCIGNGFAMMEATLLLATIWSRFDLALVPGHVPAPQPTVTLRPRGGLPMLVRAAPGT